MISIQKVLVSSLAGCAALMIGAASAPTPAEAGKLGATITKAAVKATVKGVARSGRRGDKDEDELDSRSRATNKVDPEERAAMAKAKLDAEKAEAPQPSVALMSAPVGPQKGIVCLAGC